MNVFQGFTHSWLRCSRPNTLQYGFIIDSGDFERPAETVKTDGVAASINFRMLDVTGTSSEKAF